MSSAVCATSARVVAPRAAVRARASSERRPVPAPNRRSMLASVPALLLATGARPALPDLPFVEVYDRPGADPRRPESANDERSRLYAALNAAVEAEDYEEARRLKEQIDTAMMPEMKDTL